MMKAPLYILLFVPVNILIAWWNNKLRLKAIKAKKDDAINHPLWGAMYFAFCAPVIYYDRLFEKTTEYDWWLFAAVLFLHLSVFPVTFNRYSDLPAFNLSKTSKAITDRIMVGAGLHDTEIVNITAQLLSFTFLILSIIKK